MVAEATRDRQAPHGLVARQRCGEALRLPLEVAVVGGLRHSESGGPPMTKQVLIVYSKSRQGAARRWEVILGNAPGHKAGLRSEKEFATSQARE